MYCHEQYSAVKVHVSGTQLCFLSSTGILLRPQITEWNIHGCSTTTFTYVNTYDIFSAKVGQKKKIFLAERVGN